MALTKNIPESGQEPLKKMPPIEPATLATTPAARPHAPKPSGSDRKDDNLPEKVTHAEIKQQSKRYGGW